MFVGWLYLMRVACIIASRFILAFGLMHKIVISSCLSQVAMWLFGHRRSRCALELRCYSNVEHDTWMLRISVYYLFVNSLFKVVLLSYHSVCTSGFLSRVKRFQEGRVGFARLRFSKTCSRTLIRYIYVAGVRKFILSGLFRVKLSGSLLESS